MCRIDISNLKVPPDKKELSVARYFSALGKSVVFISPSAIPNQHRPDVFMDGLEWEIKCPEGNSDRTIENNLRKALRQSKNVIFDLRYIKYPEDRSLAKLEKEYKINHQLRRLYIIKKNGELISLKSKC